MNQEERNVIMFALQLGVRSKTLECIRAIDVRKQVAEGCVTVNISCLKRWPKGHTGRLRLPCTCYGHNRDEDKNCFVHEKGVSLPVFPIDGALYSKALGRFRLSRHSPRRTMAIFLRYLLEQQKVDTSSSSYQLLIRRMEYALCWTPNSAMLRRYSDDFQDFDFNRLAQAWGVVAWIDCETKWPLKNFWDDSAWSQSKLPTSRNWVPILRQPDTATFRLGKLRARKGNRRGKAASSTSNITLEERVEEESPVESMAFYEDSEHLSNDTPDTSNGVQAETKTDKSAIQRFLFGR